MKRYNFCYIAFFILIFVLQSCATKPPENPDNICLIFQEKRSWYKAAIRSEKRWKIPPYVLISFVHQESSFKSDARPEREKILGVIPWFRPSTAVGYSQALTKTWDDYKDETLIQEQIEKILVTLQILSVGTQAKVIIKVLKKLTQDLCILLITKDMEGLKKSLIVKSNG